MKCIVRVVVFATGLACSLAPISVCAVTNTESGGVIVFEAEDNSANLTRGSDHQWTLTNSVAGYSGSGYMAALPDSGSNFTANVATTSPELQYLVNFSLAGQHFVWIRGYAAGAVSDSVHAGLDGTATTATNISSFTPFNTWVWTNRTAAGNAATITVGSTGVHTFSLWMGQDGMLVDRVLLTTNAGFRPTIGNVFHVPNDIEADLGVTMRNPLTSIFSNTTVQLFTGNQFQGSGNPGNQLTTGSTP